MRSSGMNNQASQKSLTGQAWDGIVTFLFKTAIPLVPVLGLAYVCAMIINSEVSGTYLGTVPGNGALKLDLTEDSDHLSGYAILRTREKYKVVDGKMLDDNKFQLRLQSDDATAIGGVDSTSSSAVKPVPEKLEEVPSGNESAVPKNLSGSVLADEQKSVGPEISLEGSMSFGTMEAKLISEGQSIPFEAKRNVFSSFFGWRWWNRSLRYFGIKA